MIRRLILSLVLISVAAPSGAATFASLRGDKVYLREGPTFQHRVLWIYKRKDYPLEVLSTYQGWKRVRDVDGTIGWVSQMMVSDARTVLVIGSAKAPIRSDSDPTSAIRAFAQPGVVAKLKACQPSFCQVMADGLKGWIDKKSLWGVDAGESFQ